MICTLCNSFRSGFALSLGLELEILLRFDYPTASSWLLDFLHLITVGQCNAGLPHSLTEEWVPSQLPAFFLQLAGTNALGRGGCTAPPQPSSMSQSPFLEDELGSRTRDTPLRWT